MVTPKYNQLFFFLQLTVSRISKLLESGIEFIENVICKLITIVFAVLNQLGFLKILVREGKKPIKWIQGWEG